MLNTISERYVASFRDAVRVNNTRFDDEIKDLISSARADLCLEGVLSKKVCDEKDPLIKRAISAYIKAEFGLDNADAPKYRESYEMLKRKLTLSSEYTEEA